MKLHHVQLAIPPNSESQCREFYCVILGWEERPKPLALAKRGGLWLTNGEVDLHLGVEQDFRPALKAHPAFLTTNLTAIAAILAKHNHIVTWDDELEAFDRFYVSDAVGNRLEFMQTKPV
ncbi:MAG: glyoxalase [Rhizobiaceae bacterium]